MSDAILDILRASPNCRITFITSKPRRKSSEGDVKFVRGKRMVRRQVFCKHERAYQVRRGRPVFEWVREDADPS
jgi:hypothetical protein